jgi:hypothetical protein
VLASTGGTVASALALSVAVLAGSGVEADESSVHVKLASENDVGPVVAAPVSGVESAPSMCPSLLSRWQGREVVFPSKTQAQKKALVSVEMSHVQQSAFDLCAFCRWTAARRAAVRVPPSPTKNLSRYGRSFFVCGGSTRPPHCRQITLPLGRVCGSGTSQGHGNVFS